MASDGRSAAEEPRPTPARTGLPEPLVERLALATVAFYATLLDNNDVDRITLAAQDLHTQIEIAALVP